jgi:ribosomal subunit interface protein
MKITYTGNPEALTPAENRKIDQKFAKLAKLVDRRDGEAEAHVILAVERHLKRAEITVRYWDHKLVSESAAADFFTATTDALDKLEQQLLKLRTKWRDAKRGPKQELEAAPEVEAPAPATAGAQTFSRTKPAPEVDPDVPTEPQVRHISHHEYRKPMTLDEAILESDGRDYVVYRDADTGHVSVLIRREDGNFDLIEA